MVTKLLVEGLWSQEIWNWVILQVLRWCIGRFYDL